MRSQLTNLSCLFSYCVMRKMWYVRALAGSQSHGLRCKFRRSDILSPFLPLVRPQFDLFISCPRSSCSSTSRGLPYSNLQSRPGGISLLNYPSVHQSLTSMSICPAATSFIIAAPPIPLPSYSIFPLFLSASFSLCSWRSPGAHCRAVLINKQ